MQIAKNNILRLILSKSRDYYVKNLYEEFCGVSIKILFYKTAVTFMIKNELAKLIFHDLTPDEN